MSVAGTFITLEPVPASRYLILFKKVKQNLTIIIPSEIEKTLAIKTSIKLPVFARTRLLLHVLDKTQQHHGSVYKRKAWGHISNTPSCGQQANHVYFFYLIHFFLPAQEHNILTRGKIRRRKKSQQETTARIPTTKPTGSSFLDSMSDRPPPRQKETRPHVTHELPAFQQKPLLPSWRLTY